MNQAGSPDEIQPEGPADAGRANIRSVDIPHRWPPDQQGQLGAYEALNRLVDSDRLPESVEEQTRALLNDFDALKTANEAERSQVTWVKPPLVMLGLGLPGCILVGFGIFGVSLCRALGWALETSSALPFARLVALVVGAALCIYASPARVPAHLVPEKESDPPIDPDEWKHRPIMK